MLTWIKNRLWILAGVLALGLAFLAIVGPKVVELDQYLDRQLERVKARR